MIRVLIFILLIIVCSCTPGGVAGTGTNAGNGKVCATILYSDGTPASKVSIFIREESYLCDTLRAGKPRVADYRTNCAGEFSTDSLQDGSYLLEINDNCLYSIGVPLSIDKGNIYTVDDTIYLNRGSNLEGSVALDDIPSGVPVYAQLRGLEYVQKVSGDGRFCFINIPPGEHFVNLVSGIEESGVVVDYAAETKEDETTSLEEISFPLSLVEDTLYVRQLLDLHGHDTISVMTVVDIVKGRVFRLKLDSLGLHTMPKGFARLRCRFVTLNNNLYTTIPLGVITHRGLIGLEIAENRVTSLPDQMGTAERLKYLKLSGNDLSSGIDVLTNCTHLKRIELDSCKVAVLPDDIGSLQNLEELTLNGNELTALPISITSINSLSEISINGNRLHTLPKEITEWLNTTAKDSLWQESQRP